MDRSDYIKILLRRRDTDIPEAIKKFQAIIKDLTEKSKAVDEELNYLIGASELKTIFDLPALIWAIIGKEFSHPRNEIYALCLASPKFGGMMDLAFPGNLIFYEDARKVFSLLVSNFYLDRQDLQNCVDTGSERLGMLASVSWRFLENPKFQLVSLDSNEEVATFLNKIQTYKDQQNIWGAFVGKTFEMSFLTSNSPEWEILNKYGKFLLNIKIEEDGEEHSSNEVLRMLTLGKLPNIRHFLVTINGKGVYGIDAKLEHSTLQTNFRLWTYSLFYRRKETVQLSSEVAKIWQYECPDFDNCGGVPFKILKQLMFEKDLFREKYFFQNFLKEQEHNRLQIKKLMLTMRTLPQEYIKFAQNFPNLSNLTLHLFDIRKFSIASKTLPSIKTLTIIWDLRSSLVKLHHLFSAFPGLVSFHIKTYFTMDQFVARINQLLELEGEEGRRQHVYDYYQLLSIGESLAHSSIWSQIQHLINLSVTTAAKLNERSYAISYLIHKYKRLESSRVTFQSIHQTKCKYYPCPSQ